LNQLGIGSIHELCRILQQERSPQVGQLVAEAMTTNETYFFREPAQYELIRRRLLPRLCEERKATRKLRFWSAASSTGQEAYSLAMLLQMENLHGWDVKISGSDYSIKVVQRAREATYQQVEMNRGVSASLRERFFQHCGNRWQLSDTVKSMCSFETRDLRQSMAGVGPFDLVLCRNVMIYFDTESKYRILQNLRSTIVRGGWLLLGGAEATLDLPEYFDRQRIDGVTLYVAK
jgi:chemotaxis protein methyltransferase CheR